MTFGLCMSPVGLKAGRIALALAMLVGSFWGTLAVLDYVDSGEPTELVLVPANLDGGTAISSGESFGSPNKAFDGRSDTFWISKERGVAVKDNAWIGYAFRRPQMVGRITISQPPNRQNRQDFVRIEMNKNGADWFMVGSNRYRIENEPMVIDLPDGESARIWRVVAAGDNAVTNDDAWAPLEIKFFVYEARPVAAKARQ